MKLFATQRHTHRTDHQPACTIDGRWENGCSSATRDLLPAGCAPTSFTDRVRSLGLSKSLELKILESIGVLAQSPTSARSGHTSLNQVEEKELATEMLLLRHRFTETLVTSATFRQATLTVLQNIYLFRERRIFFAPPALSAEKERQEALHIFSALPAPVSLPLARTFQHSVIARVWSRICLQLTDAAQRQEEFIRLHQVVVLLNTIRNIYMVLSRGLVSKLAGGIPRNFTQPISYEDAVQIGSFGIARAAYRYHHSCGVRFSTYAAHWIYKEVTRQSRENNLLREAAHHRKRGAGTVKSESIPVGTIVEFPNGDIPEGASEQVSVETQIENRQVQNLLLSTIERVLPGDIGDIIKRRYGLPPYQGREQSVHDISTVYGKTRSSVYQREQTALKKLREHLDLELL